jgi:hypothetical protein
VDLLDSPYTFPDADAEAEVEAVDAEKAAHTESVYGTVYGSVYGVYGTHGEAAVAGSSEIVSLVRDMVHSGATSAWVYLPLLPPLLAR